MSALETYAKAVRYSEGLLHQTHLLNLRMYLNESRLPELRHAIRRITNIHLLKTLWEAGLNSDLQFEVLRRTSELTSRRTER